MKRIILLSQIAFIILNVTAQNVSYNINSVPIVGGGNVALGLNALSSTSIAKTNNVAIGNNVLRNLVGNFSGNTGVGTSALTSGGAYNTATGYAALYNNNAFTSYNTGTGSQALYSNATGNYNTSVGNNSLYTNFSGSYNTAIGNGADVATGALTNATAIGNGAIVNTSNTIQLGNSSVTQIFVGTSTNATLIAGGLQVTGGSIGIGKVLTSDAFGVASWQTLGAATSWDLSGNASTIDGTNFIGTTDNVPFNIRVNNLKAGRIDHLRYNSFYGFRAGENISRGANNTAVGTFALQSITTGYYNTANGAYALQSNSAADGNTATGMLSLNSNTSGFDNIGDGYIALAANTTGSYNTGSGTAALTNNTTGSYNTGIGYATLHGNNTGDYNTALGALADFSTLTPNLTNATALGANAIVNASNKVRIGDVNVTVIEGQPAMYTGSDGRFKTNLNEDDVKGLEFIKRLRPVVYNFDSRKFEDFLTNGMPDSLRKIRLNRDFSASTALRRSGFVAQEVEKAANEVGYNFDAIHKPDNDNDNYSLAYSQFVVPLVKAVQELSKQNDSLKNEMNELRTLIMNNLNSNIQGSIKLQKTNAVAKLFQNTPNPFNQSTVIRYSIPSTANKAMITITSLNGVKIKEFDLKSNDVQSVEIAGGQLSAGSYIYTLIVDGTLIDSKQMILTH